MVTKVTLTELPNIMEALMLLNEDTYLFNVSDMCYCEIDKNSIKIKKSSVKIQSGIKGFDRELENTITEAISNKDTRNRFMYDKKKSCMIKAKPIECKSKLFIIVTIESFDTSFSFATADHLEEMLEITNISSSLVIDTLTKIYNRKFFMDNIEYMVARATKHGTNLSLSSIDIDNFKQFNDSYGHDFGDRVLKSVANSMEAVVKELDGYFPIRLGGDEFIMVGEGRTKKELRIVMQKLLTLVGNTLLKYGTSQVGVKLSIGVAEMQEDECENYKQLYEKADKQLYVAKEKGKNRVE